MQAEAPPGKLLIYRDLEGLRTPLEFVQRVYKDTEHYLRLRKRATESVREVLRHLQGAEVAGAVRFPDSVARHWKVLLSATIEDLVAHQEDDVVFLWDELPLMLFNIRESGGEEQAMELLDALRSLRQTHPDLRMVLTGSIGLHNVITSLKRAGYPNDPTNDMDLIVVEPLAADAAVDLARQLLAGEGLTSGDPDEVARTIGEGVDGVPYFIHHVVDRLALRGQVDPAAAQAVIDGALIDPDDRWHLRHYRERMDVYYDERERTCALGLLDNLATAGGPIQFDEWFERLKAQVETDDRETALSTVTLLQRDHYVIREPGGAYRFRLPLLRRFWLLLRGLGG